MHTYTALGRDRRGKPPLTFAQNTKMHMCNAKEVVTSQFQSLWLTCPSSATIQLFVDVMATSVLLRNSIHASVRRFGLVDMHGRGGLQLSSNYMGSFNFGEKFN